MGIKAAMQVRVVRLARLATSWGVRVPPAPWLDRPCSLAVPVRTIGGEARRDVASVRPSSVCSWPQRDLQQASPVGNRDLGPPITARRWPSPFPEGQMALTPKDNLLTGQVNHLVVRKVRQVLLLGDKTWGFESVPGICGAGPTECLGE